MVCEARAYGRICYVCNGQKQTHAWQHSELYSISRRVQSRPAFGWGITSTWEAKDASAALSALPVIGGDLVFVGSER